MDAGSLLVDLLIAGLATSQIVEIWLSGSLFAPWQDRLQNQKRVAKAWYARRPAELLTCPLCLMPWVSLGVMAILLAWGARAGWRLPVYMFAVARVAHLVNDVRARFSEPEIIDQTEDVDAFTVVDDLPHDS